MSETEVRKRIESIRIGLDTTTNNRTKNELLLQLIEETKTVPIDKFCDFQALCKTLRLLFVDKEQALRSQAFRVMRYLIKDSHTVKVMQDLNMDLFVSRALERDSKFLWERMQALKLVRHVMVVDPLMVSRTVVQSLVSIAEHPKDDFRRVCLDAIRELVLINPALVASCNGIKTIVDSILDPTCQDIAGSLTLTLLFLLDEDNTRQYIRPSLDLLKLLSVFTDTNTPDSPEKEARRAAAHKALVTIMRSWTGILALTSDPNGLRSLVQLLGLPATVKGASWAREAIFDLLFEIMHVVKSEDLARVHGKTVWDRTGPNLVHSYIVIVLFALMDCGLVHILTHLGMCGDKEFSGVATKLLTEILRLSSDLLPREVCAKLNALAVVVGSAAGFEGDVSSRVRALNMITNLNLATTSNRRRGLFAMLDGRKDGSLYGPRGGESDVDRTTDADTMSHGLNLERVVVKTDPDGLFDRNTEVIQLSESVDMRKAKSGFMGFLRASEATLDDSELQTYLKKSMVLQSKEYKQWDFAVCLQLLNGPLLSPTALASACKTKFIKRLLSFLRPSKGVFAELPWTVPNMIFLRMGCQLFRVMLSSPEGREYPFFVELLNELFGMLMDETAKGHSESSLNMPSHNRAMSMSPDSEEAKRIAAARKAKRGKTVGHPLSRVYCASKMAREYFTFFGILSSSQFGMSYFDNYRVFDTLAPISQEWSLDYICRLLLLNLDLSMKDQEVFGTGARGLLDSWIRNGSPNLRMFIISHLRLLLRSEMSLYYEWVIPLLVQQLAVSSPAPTTPAEDVQIAMCALCLLEEACQDAKCLDLVIASKPNFKLVGSAANPLCMMFLSTPAGCDYIKANLWLEPQLRYWKNGGTCRYVENLEGALVTALNAGVQQTGPRTDKAAAGPTVLSEDAFSPAGMPGQQPWAALASLRADSDDYLFNRMYKLPWTIEVSATSAKGRQIISIITETFVHTGYAAAEEGGGIGTWVVAAVLEFDGKPKAYRFDKSHVLLARISIGDGRPKSSGGGLTFSSQSGSTVEEGGGLVGGDQGEDDGLKTTGGAHHKFLDYSSFYFSEDPKESERVCTPDDRKTLTPEKPVLLGENIRWHFLVTAQTVELKSVWFRIPTPTIPMTTVSLAPHLYGELAKTHFGIGKLRDHIFQDLLEQVKSNNASAVVKRAALWAIGHIGSAPLGFDMLQETDVVSYISDQAKHCHTLSMRGTCFYILGLLSRTEASRKVLASLGWQFSGHLHAGVVIPPMPANLASLVEEAKFYETKQGLPEHLMSGTEKRGHPNANLNFPNNNREPVRPDFARLQSNYFSVADNFPEVDDSSSSDDGFLTIPKTKFIGSWALDPRNRYGVKHVPAKGDKPSDKKDGDSPAMDGGGGGGAAGPAPSPNAKSEEKKEPSLQGPLVLGHISNLCNHVTQKGSLQSLRQLKGEPGIKRLFSSTTMLWEAFKLLTTYTYRLPARRFILFDLFNWVVFDRETMAPFDQDFSTDLDETKLALRLKDEEKMDKKYQDQEKAREPSGNEEEGEQFGGGDMEEPAYEPEVSQGGHKDEEEHEHEQEHDPVGAAPEIKPKQSLAGMAEDVQSRPRQSMAADRARTMSRATDLPANSSVAPGTQTAGPGHIIVPNEQPPGKSPVASPRGTVSTRPTGVTILTPGGGGGGPGDDSLKPPKPQKPSKKTTTAPS